MFGYELMDIGTDTSVPISLIIQSDLILDYRNNQWKLIWIQ